jgi:CelD/BcsL family acetyltransferase involved in cellulose biosynthesis
VTATIERPQSKLRSAWFRSVTPELESAVRSLPEGPLCPPELLLSLLELNLAHGGRVALVERGGEPIAALGLRRDGRMRWRSMTNWLMPGTVGFAREEDVVPAVRALNVEVALVWFNTRTAPEGAGVHSAPVRANNVMEIAEREAYWHANRYIKTIRAARRKCAELTVDTDRSGDAEWVIRQTADKWAERGDRRDPFAIEANIEIARQLTPLGRFVTLALRDGETPLAGMTNFISGDTLVAAILFRDESVGALPTGVRIYDEGFEYCARAGLARLDMGTGFPYKKRWAPEAGFTYQFVVSPPLIALAHKLRHSGGAR